MGRDFRYEDYLEYAKDPDFAPTEPNEYLGSEPLNITRTKQRFLGRSQDNILKDYYTKNLNNAGPFRIANIIHASENPKVKKDYREHQRLKSYAEYLQDKEFYNNRNEDMNNKEYYLSTTPQKLESPMPVLGTGHNALIKRQRKRELLKQHKLGNENATHELLNSVYGKGSI